MNSYEDLPDSPEPSVASLPRTKCTFDFSKLLSHRRRASRTSENRLSTADTRRSKNNQSENNQVLYMPETEKLRDQRATRRSLSSISNGAGRRFDGSADSKFDLDSPADTMSRNMIDREIFEWQYVCQSGRPYWWSPESKYACQQKLQQRVASEQEERFGMQGIGNAPKAQYDMRRRAISDSYLADPNAVHDLAHLVAVQLLGACFTLPPDSITAVTPEYTRDEDGICRVQDSRLISSLRMHTHFRYSPSFGHQARNTSPVQVWSGRFDGPNAGSPPIRSNTDTSTPNIGTSSPCSRHPRSYRPLHNTEGSGYGDEEDYIRTCCSPNELDPSVGATAWYRRQGVHDPNNRSIAMPHMPSAGSKRRAARAPECSRDEEAAVTDSRAGPSAPRANYRLQPVLRSEPHPVFIQPVRELVVKRWKNFRRRMSGSLHSALPSRASEDLTSASESSASGTSSPILSSDAKIRRLRAQERGDIHGSSVDSTPHYNTPRSGQMSPNGTELGLPVRSPTPIFPLGDPLAAAASLVAAEMSHLRANAPSTPGVTTASDIISSRELIRSPASSTLAVCGTSHTRSEFPSLSPSSKPNTPSSTYSFSSQRSVGRQRRRSMLSEVCTSEDFRTSKSPDTEGIMEPISRSILSAVGSTLTSPKEERVSAYPFGPRRIQEAMSSPGPSVLPTLAELRGFNAQDRPKMSRTSTNGTQIFTPSDDGVEIDGLPAGPSKEVWAGKGGRRERTYL
ncbi:uncharacterized protein PAC_07761 [Phialocephala subalpina]|uniref:Uncharacterized protein n=1 Tax=Phialocephala subalpina TaxID=576137 RepID=A0A1L7WYM0_9HELO|nr:uncharacterized protein PAC_07761 [Phialocephala subalpina]